MSRMTSKDLSIIDEEEYKDQVVLELTPTIFKTIGDFFNYTNFRGENLLSFTKPKDMGYYPFPLLTKKDSRFRLSAEILYNYYKLYHLKRWNWSIED